MNILLYLETQDNQLKKTAFEAITAAGHLNAEKVVGVIINGTQEQVTATAAYGLPECVLCNHSLLSKHSPTAIATALAQIATQEQANLIIIPASSHGKEIAPRLAVKLEAGFAPDCIELHNDNNILTAVRPVYAGKARAKIRIETHQKVVTIRPNVFTAKKALSPSALSTREFNPTLQNSDVKAVVESISRAVGKLDVAEAEIIVSGGRGLKGPENFYLVEDLAKALGAAVGASRAVVDAGWRPHSEQVGQTGKTVSPTMYIACGISGAVQHLAGMSSSKVIVAINKDKDAPIFQIADYGIVGDIFDILPKLTKKIAEVVQH